MGHKTLGLVLLLTALAVATATGFIAVGDTTLRAVCTIPLVLVLPGYAVVAALFPDRALEGTERLLFALGASIALTVICGLLLNIAPGGMRDDSWAATLGVVTVGAGAIALARLRPHTFSWRRPFPQPWRRSFPRQWALYGLASCLTIGAVVVAGNGEATQPHPGFTQLWMLPSGAAGSTSVRLGVSSMEQAPVRYRLQVLAGTRVLRRWPDFALKPRDTWTATTILPVVGRGATRVDAVLYRLDTGKLYRHVALWSSGGSRG